MGEGEQILVCILNVKLSQCLNLWAVKPIPEILFVELIQYIWERLKIAGNHSRLNVLCARKRFIFMLVK